MSPAHSCHVNPAVFFQRSQVEGIQITGFPTVILFPAGKSPKRRVPWPVILTTGLVADGDGDGDSRVTYRSMYLP